MRELAMLNTTEQQVLGAFRKYLMTPHKMLCFYGPDLQQKSAALESLAQKELLHRESISGAYSLTQAGYEAMKKQQLV